MNSTFRVFFNIFCFVAVIVVNALSNAIPFNNLNQQQLSKMYPIYLSPAPYVFSIWGVIYMGLLIYVVYQVLPKQRENQTVRQLDLPFVLSSFCNIGWLFAWHFCYLKLSLLWMFGLLGSLMLAYLRLEKTSSQSPESQRWFVNGTFSVYLAWVSLATILNISIWLYTLPWRGAPFLETTWAAILLGIALLLFVFIALPRKDSAIFGVLAWASFGIQVKNAQIPVISITALVVFGISLILFLWSFWKNRFPGFPSSFEKKNA